MLKEELMDEYDGTIKASETVGREDVVVHFKANSEHVWTSRGGGFRYGKATAWKPRKKVLMVKVRGIKKHYEVDEEHVIDAYVGEKGDRDKVRVEWR